MGLEDADDEGIREQQEDVRTAAVELAAEERPAEAVTLELLESVRDRRRAEVEGRREDVERLARRIEELHTRLAEASSSVSPGDLRAGTEASPRS